MERSSARAGALLTGADPSPPTWHVYIVECADGTLYTGATNDVPARVEQHNSGRGAKYTRSRLPVHLVYIEAAGARGAALCRERKIKRLPRPAKRRLIELRPLGGQSVPP